MAGTSPLNNPSPGLKGVRTLLAVSSCKGGVGKSTTAVNIACSLQQQGYKVGLFDADIYGPSLPTMIQPKETQVFQSGELIIPLDHHGIKLMSFGYIPKEGDNDAAIMRGPMVTQVIAQLLGQTEWGTLDYLVIDFPPGTGDIQLTLAQIARITAAIIVTTPQRLSFVDVVKGIKMFDKLKIPTLGVVENMSYFEVNDERHYIFGEGARDRLVNEFGFQHTYQMPIVKEISEAGDSGEPFAFQFPDSPLTKAYHDVASMAAAECEKIHSGNANPPVLSYNVGADMMLTLPDGTEHEFSPLDLRMICGCASCVDEMTGKRIIQRETLDPDLYPTKINPMGNYAAAVEWSDGTNSCIFPFERILNELVKA